MSGNSNLTVALKFTADPKAVIDAAQASRRELLQAFKDAHAAANQAAAAWKLAESEVKRLAATSAQSAGDQSKYSKALEDAQAVAAKAKSEYLSLADAERKRRVELASNAAAIAAATEAQQAQAAAMTSAKKAAEEQAVAEAKLARARREAGRVSDARAVLDVRPFREIDQEIKRVEAAYKRLAASGKASSAELAQAQLKVIERTKELAAQKNGLVETFARVRASVLAVTAAFGLLAAASREAMRMETAMAEVDKVADFKSPEGLDEFKNLLQDLTGVIPYTARELAALAAAGAQMGIPKDDLASFTVLAGEMGVAFKMAAEDTGNASAKIMNVYKLTLDQVEDLADSINHLGNNTNAAERDIVNIMVRVGGTARIFGLAAKETAALASAFLSMGRTPEVAANAINALLVKLATVPQAEPKARAAFERLGLSVDEFSALVKAKPVAALETFLATLERMPKSAQMEILSGFAGMEYADDIALLTEGLEKYREAVVLAHAAEAKGAMGREAAKQAGTSEAAMRRAAEQIRAAGDALGESFLPVIKLVAEGTAVAAAGIRDFINETGPMAAILGVVIGLAGGFGALRVAASSLALVSGGLAARIGMGAGLAGGLTRVAGALGAVAPWVMRLIPILGALSLAWYVVSKAMDYFSGNAEKEAAAAAEKTAKGMGKIDEQIKRLDTAGLIDAANKLRDLKRAAASNEDVDIDRTVSSARAYADEVLRVHTELAAAKERLAQATAARQAVLSGQETAAEKKSVDDRIAAVKKLGDEKRRELDQAINDLKRYQDAATNAYSRAADVQISTADRVRELRRRDMNESKQQVDIAAQAAEKISAAQQKLAEAQAAAARGDTTGAEKAAREAEQFAQAAEGLGSSLKKTSEAVAVVENAGKVAAAAAKAVGDANARAASEAESKSRDIRQTLDDLASQLESLERQKRLVQIDADISSAAAAVSALQDRMAELKDKTVTVTVLTRNVEAHQAGGPVGGVLHLNRGGRLPGYGGGDRVRALLEAGEYVVRKERARRFGALVHMINTAPLSRLNDLLSGFVGGVQRFAVGGPVMPSFSMPALSGAAGGSSAGSGSRDTVDINFNLGAERFTAQSSRDQARGLARALRELSRG